MTCQDFQILLHRDLDGVLDASEQNLLSGHLTACPRCTADQGSLQAIRGAFRDLRHVDVRAGLAEKIVEQAAAPRTTFLRIPRLALIPVAASVIGLCLLSGALGWRVKEPRVVNAAPDGNRVDEATYRRFLSDQLALPAEKVDTILKIRRDFDPKREAARVDLKDQLDKLQKAEVEEIWKVLPADAQARYLEHDRSFTPPEPATRKR